MNFKTGDKVVVIAGKDKGKEGKIMFEIGGVDEATAREALRLAMNKLPIKCKFVKKESGEAND